MVGGSLGYRPDIDVLRAFAVLPVLAFHMDESLLPGGYLGVDVFFVISGYLITRLLMIESSKGGIDLWAFWQRRILRIIPALLAVTFVTFLAGQVLLYAPDRQDLAFNSFAALLSFGNFAHWLGYGGYWGVDAASSPLLHTWSLAVEEQFYLLYPIFLLFAFRAFKGRIGWALLLLFLTSLAAFLYGAMHHPAATFYLAPTRAWELAAGAMVATLSAYVWPKRVSRGLAGAGLLLISTAYFAATPGEIGLWNVIAVLGACLVILTNTSEPFSDWGLTNRVLLSIGLLSYSLYLWHYPFIVLSEAFVFRMGYEVSWVFLLVLILSVSWASWKFIESPVRRSKELVRPALVLTVIMAGAAFGFSSVDQYEDIGIYKPTEWAGDFYSVTPSRVWANGAVQRMVGIQPSKVDGKFLLKQGVPPHLGKGVLLQYGGEEIDVLVLGDSHGLQWAPVIDQIMQDFGKTVSFMTADATPVFFDVPLVKPYPGNAFFSPDGLLSLRESTLRIIQDEKPSLVIIAAAWRQSDILKSKSLMQEIARAGARVLLIADQPWLNIGDRNAPQYLSYLGVKPNAESSDGWVDLVDYESYLDSLNVVHEIVRGCSICTVVEPGDAYLHRSDVGVYWLKVIDNDQVLYIDDDHLSVAGAAISIDIIRSAILSL